MQEIWKDIKGYEGLYQVSNLGNIKSYEKLVRNRYSYRKMPSIKLKPIKNKLGYKYVRLYKNKNNKAFLIHRLVAQAFIPNPKKYKEINHRDENPSNNCIDNLEWCDRKYNCNYGEHNVKMANSLSKKINQYDKDFILVKQWNRIRNASTTLKINAGNIVECCKGNRRSAGGYIWRYSNEN